jgi:hypothetical protein
MKDLGMMYYLLEVEVWQRTDEIFLSQGKYTVEMKDMGMMHYFLGLEVRQRIDEIFLSQGKYTMEILKKFGMIDCKSMPTSMVMDLKKMNKASTDSTRLIHISTDN